MDIHHLTHYIQWYFNMASRWVYQLVGMIIIVVIAVFGTVYLLTELTEYRKKKRHANDR